MLISLRFVRYLTHTYKPRSTRRLTSCSLAAIIIIIIIHHR